MPRRRSESSLKRSGALPAEYWQSIADDTHQADRRVSVVAEQDGLLVGMVGGLLRCDERAVHLVALWVEPAVRGRGVGRALVDPLVGWHWNDVRRGWSWGSWTPTLRRPPGTRRPDS